jgi:hypothetical protein
MDYSACPACSSKRRKAGEVIGVYQCLGCGAVYGTCYLGESYGLVRPHFVPTEPPAANLRYYDFMALGSRGPVRRHGWFDVETRLIVQVG